ncbi:hypothetical protein AAH035_20330, partial [Parabacteroides distasonis]|uniref:hypothetical protein n=1 Tax=Parabacteroides distasonis TaxID=823 RepID=UPI0039B62F8C
NIHIGLPVNKNVGICFLGYCSNRAHKEHKQYKETPPKDSYFRYIYHLHYSIRFNMIIKE